MYFIPFCYVLSPPQTPEAILGRDSLCSGVEKRLRFCPAPASNLLQNGLATSVSWVTVSEATFTENSSHSLFMRQLLWARPLWEAVHSLPPLTSLLCPPLSWKQGKYFYPHFTDEAAEAYHWV